MKSLINKNDGKCFDKKQKLVTEKLLRDYVNHYGLGYVIRHYEISHEFIDLIAKGEFSDICDEDFTKAEILAFQKTLITFITTSSF